jgi:hypothetical protein
MNNTPHSCHDKADRLITLISTTYNHPHMYHSKAEYVREHQMLARGKRVYLSQNEQLVPLSL